MISRQKSSAWWEQARAALARAFGTVRVQTVGLDAPELAGGTAVLDVTAWPIPATGESERNWRLSAETYVWHPLTAQGGGGGLDASALICAVSGSAMPTLPEQGVHALEFPALSIRVQRAELACTKKGEAGAATVLMLPVELIGGQAYTVPMALQMPPVHVASVALAGGCRSHVPPSGGRSGVPVFRAPRTASQLSRILQVPLVRRRAVLPAGADISTAFAAERQALASACGMSVEEVKLLGSFPHVPLSLVQQMAVTEGGDTLRLWLRPEPAGSGARAVQVTVVLGRRRATGETVRAVLPEAGPMGRKQ